MDSTKYIGMDVHKETISVAVMNSSGKLVMESILETKTATIPQFIQGLRGNRHGSFGQSVIDNDEERGRKKKVSPFASFAQANSCRWTCRS